ncbi:MAG: hypothetical protein ACR2KG_08915 [Nocardioidaceae bacterium]
MTEPPHDPFEERLRASLARSSRVGHIDADDFLAGVHRGARVRRAKRVLTGSVAAVALVVGVGFGVNASGILNPSQVPVATGPTAAEPSNARTPAVTTARQHLTTAQPLSLSATGDQHQFLLRAEPGPGCGSQGCASIWSTSNGGGSWQRLGNPHIQAATTAEGADTVGQVRFVGNGTDGWVFGGALRSSHDGGSTWQQPKLPLTGQVSRLEAWGSRVYAVVNGAAGASVVSSPTVADNFQPVKTTPLTSVSSLVAANSLAAFVARTGVSSPNQLFLSRTGQTWTQSPTTCQPGWWPQSLSTAGNALWMVCTHGARATARVSTTYGASWVNAQAVLTRDDVVGGRDSTTAVAVGPGITGIELISTTMPPRHVANHRLGAITMAGFTNVNRGYVMDRSGTIVRTTHGGHSWAPYPLPGS